MEKISAYIIAYNEEYKIAKAVSTVTWADEVIVADSYSADRTAEIAENHGARVIQIPFEGFGKLRNRAIEACQYDWIFSLDSDERCTPEVRDEIRRIISSPDALDAYHVPRKNWFMGRWIRHSHWFPDYRQPQLFRNGKMKYTEDPVHEGFELSGRLGYLHNAIWQIPFGELSEIVAKANRYSSLGVEKLEARGVKDSMVQALSHGLWAFFRSYCLELGILDGWPGFVIAFGNFEGTFYRYSKLVEARRGWKHPEIPPFPTKIGQRQSRHR